MLFSQRRNIVQTNKFIYFTNKFIHFTSVPGTIVASDDPHAVFAVPLAVAVERSKCHDGIELPVIFRECIDHIEEYGLTCEGIYRISGVKSKVQNLKVCILFMYSRTF